MDLSLVALGAGGLLAILVLWRLKSGGSRGAQWTRGDVDAYLESSEMYDVNELKDQGLYDLLVEEVQSRGITDERAFEYLCDAIVEQGSEWDGDLEDLDDVSQSWHAHESARKRTPPVDIGDEVRLGIIDVEHHHSGDRRGVGKVEGFVVFVQNLPAGVDEGSVVRAKVMYFNRGKTSASAKYLKRLD